MTSAAPNINHGLSTGFACLPHENQSEINSLAQRLRADLRPGGEHESFLVDRMIEARWRIVRINRLEAAAFDLILEPGKPESPDSRIAAHLTPKGGDLLSVLQRYAAAAERSYHRNYKELLHGRQVSERVERKSIDNHIKNVIFGPLPGDAVKPATAAAPQNGFVSQNRSASQNPNTANTPNTP